MTLDEALRLRVGDHVIHRAGIVYAEGGIPIMRPIRVTATWLNEKRTIMMLRLASVDASAWLQATEYELPPKGMKFDHSHNDWVTPAVYRERRAGQVA